MFRLCPEYYWKSGGNFYYFDFQTAKTFFYNYTLYEEKKEKSVGKNLPYFAGAFATILSGVFRDVYIKTDSLTLIFFLVITIGLVVALNLIINYEQFNNEQIVKSKIEGDKYSFDELNDLYKRGRKLRALILFFTGFMLLIAYFFMLNALSTHKFIYILMLQFVVLGLTPIIRALSPIQIIKFKLYIRRCKKECQNK